jgi:hypothetical protein
VRNRKKKDKKKKAEVIKRGVSLIGGIKQLKAKIKKGVPLIGGVWSRSLTIMEHKGK